MFKRWLMSVLANEITQEVEFQLNKIQIDEIDAALETASITVAAIEKLAEQQVGASECITKLTNNIDTLLKHHKSIAIGMLDLKDRLEAIEENKYERVLH